MFVVSYLTCDWLIISLRGFVSLSPHNEASSLLQTGCDQLKMVACRLPWVITSLGLRPGVQQTVNDVLCEQGGKLVGEEVERFSAEGTTFTGFSTSFSWDHMLESVSSGEGTQHQSMIAMSGKKICQKVTLELGERPLVA